MDNAHYKYKGKSWRHCPTKLDNNSFFHSAFGTRDREGEELLDEDAHFRRMRWATFLTYFASKSKPPRLAELLRKCFTADDKYKNASIDDRENLMRYVLDIIASERKVTIEEIPILATLENIQILVLSTTRSDAAITVKPNLDILGSYPIVEKAKEEVVLCLEGDTFSRLELVKEESVPDDIADIIIKKEKAAQSKNNSGRYKKGGSAGSKGVRYQVDLLTIVLLNAFKNLREWKLSSENEDSGKFDDIVLEETQGATFIQSKHKEKKGKRITLDDLTSTNSKSDDFSLPKYFLSYLQIKKKFKIKNVILCTNADVHERVLKLLHRHEMCSESILYFDTEDYSFHTLKDEILHDLKVNIKSYHQQNFRKKDIEESAINEDNLRDFQKHLQLYFNYPSLNRMESIIDKSLSLIRCCTSSHGKIFSTEIHSKMTEWYQQEEGTYLTQTHARAMFSEIWREKYCQQLEEYKVSFHTDDLNFQHPTQIFHVITNGGYLLQVIKVYHAIRGDRKKILFVSLHDDTDIQKQAVKAFGLPEYTFLIIIFPEATKESAVMEVFGGLKGILEDRAYKKIIVVAEDIIRFVQRIGWDKEVVRVTRPVTFEDLHSLSQERLLKRKNIVFQGEKLSLEEIFEVQNTEEYGRALNPEILERLVRGEEIIIGKPPSELDGDLDKYYVSRTFKRTSDEIYSDEVEEEERFTEVNIYDVKEKVVVISDGAGTGKSTALIKLAETIKEKKPYLWVIRLELKDYTGILKHSLRNGKKSVTITELLNSANATRLKNHLEEFLFSASQKVVLMLDAVDEISPDYTELIIDLLKQCREDSNFAKIFITTRPHMMKELEQVSKVKPFILQPFTEPNQISFLSNYWENSLHLKDDISKEKCKRYAEALVRKWMHLDNNEGNRFATVPLQLRMMAEIFQETAKSDESGGWEGCKEYVMGSEAQPNTSERLNITDLYRLFVEKKQYIFAEKGNPSGNTIASASISKIFDDCLVYHQSLALEVTLGKEKLHLFSCYKRVDESIEAQLLKIGIVQKNKDEMHFIHRTFADYFVAECLFSELRQNPTLEFQTFLIDTIFIHPQYSVTVMFLDRFLQKNSVSPIVFKEYRSLNQENLMEVFKLQGHLLHLLAEKDCQAILLLILNCVDFQIIKNKETDFQSFYDTRFDEDVHKNIFGNTLNFLECLTQEAGVNIKDGEGCTPLHYAAKEGHLEMAKFLVERGADINVKNEFGNTSFQMALLGDHWNTIKFLLEHGADSSIKNNAGFTALHSAAFFGQLDIVKLLVEDGSDFNVVNKFGCTLLDSACRNGHLETVKYLFELGIVSNIRNDSGFTALQTATYFGNLEIVKFLTEHGSDFNEEDNCGNTLLHLSSRKGHLDIVKYLLELGIDCHIRDTDGFTALQTAAYFGQLEIMKFLAEHGSDLNVACNIGTTLLHSASEKGHLDIVKYLLELGIDCHIRDNDGFTSLQTAAYFGHLEIVKLLTEHGSDFNVVSNIGNTLLHSASETGHLDIVKYLSELGVDLHIRNNGGFTALQSAAYFGRLETVKFLTDHGSDSNVLSNIGYTLLHSASENGHLDTVKYLLELGIDCHIRDNDGCTALHLATYFGNLEIVKFLTENGSDFNTVDKFGNTLLHSASRNGHLDVVKYLLELGVNPSVKNSDGFTALRRAAFFGHLGVEQFLVETGLDYNQINSQFISHLANGDGHLEVIKQLLEIRADFSMRDCDGFTIIHSATKCGQLKIIKFIEQCGLDIHVSSDDDCHLLRLHGAKNHLDTIKYFLGLCVDPNTRDNCGLTAFHLVGGNDQLEIVKSFIEHGLDVNIKSTDGFTLLHLTSADGCLEMVKFLLENCSDFEVRDNDGFTPLHLAAEWGQLDAVKLLVEHGVDYNATTNDGRTPLHLASQEGHLDTVKYLLELGVDCNVRDYSGRTALHLAVLADYLNVVKLLVVDIMVKTIKAVRRYI